MVTHSNVHMCMSLPAEWEKELLLCNKYNLMHKVPKQIKTKGKFKKNFFYAPE